MRTRASVAIENNLNNIYEVLDGNFFLIRELAIISIVRVVCGDETLIEWNFSMNVLQNQSDESGIVVVAILTKREHDVLFHLAQGLSAKEVAIMLAITARTVESHIDRLRLKTRTRNRTHMVAHAIQQGLL